MQNYMVERSLKGISMEDLGGAQKAAIAEAAKMRKDGSDVAYVRTTFSPDDGRCFCLFQGNTAEDIRDLNTNAGIPFDRVTEVLDLNP